MFPSTIADTGPSAEWSPRKLQLWDQLSTIFLHEGLRTLTVGDLADRLSCSRRTLYSLAASRDELVLGVVEHLFATRTAQAAAAAAAAEPGVPAVLAHLVNGVISFEGSAAFFDDVVGRPATQRASYAYRSANHRALATLIADAIAGGQIRQCDPDLTADVLEAVTDRLAERMSAPGSLLTRAAAEHLVEDLIGPWLSPG
jgi:AcrR family transcriptional regulator